MQARAIKALIVDDNQDTCEVISDFLKEDNYRTTIVFDGKKALERIKRESYDIMILDYTLCGISGLELLKKTCQLRPALRTIMISGSADDSVKIRAKELGAYAFLDKPFNIDGLVRLIKEALNKKKRRCVNEANGNSKYSCSTSNEHLGSSNFCSRERSSDSPINGSKDRHSVHIGAS